MSTKSAKSAGTQVTKKGIVQGVVLVDPVTGNPLNVIFEGGQYKLVVKGDSSGGGGGPTADVNIISSIPIGIKDQTTGNIFKINADGSIDANVILDASSDNVAIADAISGNKLKINTDGSTNSLMLNKLIDVPHDDIEVTAYNLDGNPTTVLVRKSGSLVRTLTLSYNSDGDFQRVQRT